MRPSVRALAALTSLVRGTESVSHEGSWKTAISNSTTFITRGGGHSHKWAMHNITTRSAATATGPSWAHVTAPVPSNDTRLSTGLLILHSSLVNDTLQPSTTNASQTTSYSYGLVPDSTYTPCDYSKSFPNLAAMDNVPASQPPSCVADYSLDTLINMLNAASANYTAVNKGYDTQFVNYVQYMKDYVLDEMEDRFMIAWANVSANAIYAPLGPGMDYFDCSIAGGPYFACSQLGDQNKFLSMAGKTTNFKLRDDSGFWNALLSIGISEDWITWQDSHEISKSMTTGNERRSPAQGPGDIPSPVTNSQTTRKKYTFTHWPVQNGSMVVTNPKDAIANIGSIPDLQTSMQATLMEMMLGMWSNGTTASPSEVYSAPVFMLMTAVDNMAQAKALGVKEAEIEAEQAKQRKDFILTIISIFLMAVPVVGEEFAAIAGATDIARAISIGGDVGNAAMDLYQVVSEPQNALSTIFGRLLGIGGATKIFRDGKDMEELANTYKAFRASGGMKAFGEIFTKNDNLLQKILSVCPAGAKHR